MVVLLRSSVNIIEIHDYSAALDWFDYGENSTNWLNPTLSIV